MQPRIPTTRTAPPEPRRFGAVNWRGLWTLSIRDPLRTLKGFHYAIVGPVIQNLLFLAVFQLALGGAGAEIGALSFGQFLVPGLIIFTICDRAFGTSGEWLLYDKQLHAIADTIMAPLTPIERIIGYTAGATLTGLATGAAVAAALLPFVMPPLESLPLLLFFAVAGAVIHALVGVIVGLWSEKWDHYTVAHNFLVIPFAFLSGTFYSLTALPETGQKLVTLNPVFYVIDGFRAGATGQAERPVELGMAVVALTVIALAVWAHHLIRIGYKVKP
ncbi:MAG: ABC transporter permease [Dongiaceae bacterium]